MTRVACRRLSWHGTHSRERDLILAGLFELTITYLEDAEKIAQCRELAAKLGGDPGAMFFEPMP